MQSLEAKVAIVSIIVVCLVAYTNLQTGWMWILVLLIAIPSLAGRFPWIGYLLGGAFLLFPFILLSQRTSSYGLLFALGIAIYGGFLVYSAFSQPLQEKHLPPRRSSDSETHRHLQDQISASLYSTGTNAWFKTLLRITKLAIDTSILGVAGLVSLPTFLALWYFGLTWPLLLGSMTFALYMWRIIRHPETLAIKNPWDLRWHGFVLCLCCLLWVLIIGLVPLNSLRVIQSYLPDLLSNPAWFEFGEAINHYLNHLISLMTTGVILTFLSYLPTLLGLLLSGWLMYRSFFALPGDLQSRTRILRWPVFSLILVLIIIWPSLAHLHHFLFNCMASYASEATRLVEILIIGFLPWRVGRIIFGTPGS